MKKRVSFVLVVLAALAGCKKTTQEGPAPSSSGATNESVEVMGRRNGSEVGASDGGQAGQFGLYVLALSWAPNFCCGHESKEQCSALTGSFGATHLTLHGLWPNFTDDESKKAHADYPQFCGDFKKCKKNGNDKSCIPDPSTIPEEMKKLGPGYIGDHYFLADHEWPKHGSCTGLDAASYFKAAIEAMKQRGGEDGTPDALRNAIGKSIALTELQSAFGVPATSVLLSCDAQCKLSQVGICLGHDAKGNPTGPVPCPSNTTTSNYDNGCVVHNCAQINVQAAGSCDIRNKPVDPGHPDRPSNKCNHPGQGPACTSDASCTQAGFLRCANSGCCTSVPK